MSRIVVWMTASLGGVTLLAASAPAQEITTYSYDGLGRLKSSSISGGPNNSRKTSSCFDAAGNRLRYDVATTVPAACPVPTPTPTSSP